MSKLYIAIPTYNRLALAEQCIPTVRAGAHSDVLVVYDDGSRENVLWSRALMAAADRIVHAPSVGVDAQRREHFLSFWSQRQHHGCSHLYLTDADAPHDPAWREHALALQAEHKAPICLYRTKTHADYANNVFRDEPRENVIWQRFSPGVSLLLDVGMVERVVSHMPERWSWDWQVPALLGYKMAVSRVSYCEHIGYLGQHDPERGVGPERATNPTQNLIRMRHEILANLGLNDA